MSRTSLALMLALAAACKPETPTHESPPVAAESERAALLATGAEAPRIEAVAHNGQKVSLADYRGKPVVVYFYPKDETPGCTAEAESFRDEFGELSKLGVVVIGVSNDDDASHRAFAEKHELPFLLLADTDHRIANAFGVPLTNGRAKRVTFVIDKQGKIARVFPDVSPRQHAAEVRAAVSAITS